MTSARAAPGFSASNFSIRPLMRPLSFACIARIYAECSMRVIDGKAGGGAEEQQRRAELCLADASVVGSAVETFAPLSRTNSVACSNWKCFFGLQKGSSPLTGCASSSPKTHRSVQKAKEKVWGIQGPLVGCAPSYPLPISFI